MRFDERTMTFTLEVEDDEGDEIEIALPARYEVCHGCRGKGTHVNRNIDGNGITASEWAEWDEDEKDDYLSGAYDVTCEDCHGRRVVAEVDRENADEKAGACALRRVRGE